MGKIQSLGCHIDFFLFCRAVLLLQGCLLHVLCVKLVCVTHLLTCTKGDCILVKLLLVCQGGGSTDAVSHRPIYCSFLVPSVSPHHVHKWAFRWGISAASALSEVRIFLFCSVICCFGNFFGSWYIYHRLITDIWLKTYNCDCSEKRGSCEDVLCSYSCNVSLHIISFLKLCPWRYTVFVVSCIIHFKFAVLTTVHTNLCVFCITSWLMGQQVPFQNR
jgi:hypothetical protein